ncbi:putative leader peptide [Jatrophihabitans sp. GAS493]
MRSEKLAAGQAQPHSLGCLIERRHIDLARVASALCRR